MNYKNFKYEYFGIKSRTKLNHVEIDMVEYWKHFFNVIGDKLLAYSKYDGLMSEKKGLIEFHDSPFVRRRTKLEEALLKVLIKYGYIFGKDKKDAISKLDVFKFRARQNIPIDLKIFESDLVDCVFLGCNSENVKLELIGSLLPVNFTTGRHSSIIVYNVYRFTDKGCKSISDIAKGDLSTIKLRIKEEMVNSFNVKCLGNKFKHMEFETVEEMVRTYNNFKNQESDIVANLTHRLSNVILNDKRLAEELLCDFNLEKFEIVIKRRDNV